MGGGTGPADGTRATTCTPAPVHMKLMLQATDDLPLNFGFTGKVLFGSFEIFTFFILFSFPCVHQGGLISVIILNDKRDDLNLVLSITLGEQFYT